MRIILLGAPGSGKGTQAKKLMDDFGFPQISTGNLLRRAISEGTEIGKQAKAIMAAGDLVSDEIVLDLIRFSLDSPSCLSGFILDGYPRNITQAESLNKVLKDIDRNIDRILFLDVDFEVLESRIESRTKENNEEKRADDTSEVLIKRLEEYKIQTAPLGEYYSNNKKFKKINGMKSISEVSLDIENFLDNGI